MENMNHYCYECKFFSYDAVGRSVCRKDNEYTHNYAIKKCYSNRKGNGNEE